MTKKTAEARVTLSALARELAQEGADASATGLDGLPTSAAEAQMNADETAHPLTDADFFDYCDMAFIRAGIPLEYYLKKDGKYLTTLQPPLNWERVRERFGAGHYLVIAKNRITKAFVKQKTEMLEELNDTQATLSALAGDAGPDAGYGSPQSDLGALMAMMQTQNESRAQQAREDRERDEARRREDREREELRLTRERDSRNDLFKTIAALATPLLPMLFTKKDDSPMLEVLREQTRNSQAQSEKLLERFERLTERKSEASPLELMKQITDAEDRGAKRERAMYDRIEDLAAERAEQMAGKSDEDESMLSMMLKNLGPHLGTLLAAAGKGALPAPGQPVEVATLPPQAARDVPAQTMNPNQAEQEKVLQIIFPVLAESLQASQAGNPPPAGPAAQKSLGLLKAQGYSQNRVLELFPQATFLAVLEHYQLPKQYTPWFNEYYEALASIEVSASSGATLGGARTARRARPVSASPARVRGQDGRQEDRRERGGVGSGHDADGAAPLSGGSAGVVGVTAANDGGAGGSAPLDA